jgi:hypothetical protein
MRIGCASVSTLDQNLELQEDALKAAGCEKIYTDKIGVTKAERAGLERALADLRSGDRLVVWKLDRLGRSLRHLIETVSAVRDRGVGFQSLQEAIDTTTSGGKLIFHVSRLQTPRAKSRASPLAFPWRLSVVASGHDGPRGARRAVHMRVGQPAAWILSV